ncbi:MAG TPA: MASE1 domain-containing protein, partial [Terriglobales bacterium]|nr:MASE1 domain-containing protein [Terriglobales bacterium]
MTGRRYLATLAGLAAVYFVAGRLGLALAFVNRSATAVWAPTGIALAAFLVLGYRFWPGILAGAFFVNLATSGGIAISAGIAIGNTLEGLIGAYVANRFAGGRRAFERPQDVFKFAFFAGVLSTLVSATFGSTSLVAGGRASWAEYRPIWLTWWLGDMVGDFVIAPFLLLWAEGQRPRWNGRRVAEAALLVTSLLAVGGAVFGGRAPGGGSYLCIPILIWAAFRFGPRETAAASLLLSAIAIWGTLRGFGPFAVNSPNESLLRLQAYMGVVTVMVIAIAVVVRRQRTADQINAQLLAELRAQR